MNTVIYRIIKNWYKPVLGLLLAVSPLSGVPYLYPKEVCFLPEGCPIKDGVCEGCELQWDEENDWGKIVNVSEFETDWVAVVAKCKAMTFTLPSIMLVEYKGKYPVYSVTRKTQNICQKDSLVSVVFYVGDTEEFSIHLLEGI